MPLGRDERWLSGKLQAGPRDPHDRVRGDAKIDATRLQLLAQPTNLLAKVTLDGRQAGCSAPYRQPGIVDRSSVAEHRLLYLLLEDRSGTPQIKSDAIDLDGDEPEE